MIDFYLLRVWGYAQSWCVRSGGRAHKERISFSLRWESRKILMATRLFSGWLSSSSCATLYGQERRRPICIENRTREDSFLSILLFLCCCCCCCPLNWPVRTAGRAGRKKKQNKEKEEEEMGVFVDQLRTSKRREEVEPKWRGGIDKEVWERERKESLDSRPVTFVISSPSFSFSVLCVVHAVNARRSVERRRSACLVFLFFGRVQKKKKKKILAHRTSSREPRRFFPSFLFGWRQSLRLCVGSVSSSLQCGTSVPNTRAWKKKSERERERRNRACLSKFYPFFFLLFLKKREKKNSV